jgi:hypothetical protein
MLVGGKKFQKPERTKFRKNRDANDYGQQNQKQKHHDKTLYRLIKQEKDYVLRPITQTDRYTRSKDGCIRARPN